MINIAVVGLGYWGPNLVRNIASLSGARLHTICDMQKDLLERYGQQYSNVVLQNDYELVLNDSAVNAVVIATPVATHFNLAKRALEAGKHVLVEKPLAQTSEQCRELIAIAEKNNLVLMVGHVFIFNSAVQKIKEYIQSGELGNIYYIYSQRLNLGIIRKDVNALWNFAPHDVSIICHWLDSVPTSVTASGYSYIQDGIEDVVFSTLEFPGNVSANMHISWLDPNKVRRMTIVGSEKMIVYDDVSNDAKIMIYDKGIKKTNPSDSLGSFESFAEFQLKTHAGDIVIPKIEFSEPLGTECNHFAECIRLQQRPLTDGYAGLSVVRVLEATQRAIQSGKKCVI